MVLLLVALQAGATWAQAAAKPPEPSSDVDASKVPDPEKLRTSAEGLNRMRGALKDVLAKLEEARSSKDVVKLTCVNDKLTQIKGLLRISETADVNLQESVARKETTTSDHEYTKVSIAGSKVQQLRAEAEQCMALLPPPMTLVDVRPAPASPTTGP